jgi:hypothetical protein
MKFAFACVLTLLAFTSIVRAQSSNAELSIAGEPVAYVEKLTGRVFVDRGEEFALIADRTALTAGDRVALLSESSARLSYPGNCETLITERQIHVVSLVEACVGDLGAPAMAKDAVDGIGTADTLDAGNVDDVATGDADLEALVGSFLNFDD